MSSEREPGLETPEPTGQEMALRMQETFGQKMTALIALRNVENPELDSEIDPRVVGQWARGEVDPSDVTLSRIQTTLAVVDILSEHEEIPGIQAWFMGRNTHLNGNSPTMEIASNPAEVIEAAHAYLAY